MTKMKTRALPNALREPDQVNSRDSSRACPQIRTQSSMLNANRKSAIVSGRSEAHRRRDALLGSGGDKSWQK